MNKDKIILSFPYSGALYHFVDKTLLNGKYASWSSGYYTWLFGKNPDQWVPMALTFSIVYPEIVLAPRDHPLPKMIDGEIQSTYQNPDLGLIVDWDDYHSMRDILSEKVREDMQDPVIVKLLKEMRVPSNSVGNLLYDIRYELHLSQKHKARLICAKGRKRLVNQMLRRDLALNFPSAAPAQEIQFTEKYIEFTGLEYNMDTIDDLYAIKDDESTKLYATMFRNQLDLLPKMEISEANTIFEQAANDALDASAKARKHAKRYSTGADYLSWTGPALGLLPGVGSVASIAERSLEIAANIQENTALRHEWYELASTISAVRIRQQFVRRVRSTNPRNKKP
ncbi:MAG: hypothetical protein LCI00_23570 [Chloroflexi bacterium]|nr:hypothetical protein [Chloroflexota bacterium]MCC6896035.1 hypothetical protein [Anaerolineae bacterium]